MNYDFDEIINREGTSCYKYDFRQKYFGNSDLIPMWVADMDFKTPDFVTKAILNRANHQIYGYSILSENFYNSIIYWYKMKHDWSVHKEWISYSPGVVPSLVICVLAFSEPGDKIIIQPPVYHPFLSVPRLNNRQILLNPLKETEGRYFFDFDNLIKQIDHKTKLILLCNPHNPVGRVWTKEELVTLGDICIKNKILIVSDEIHSDIVYNQNKHIPIANLSDEFSKHTITTIAPSKTFNLASLTTSAVIIPNKKLKNRFDQVANNLQMHMLNALGLAAFEAAYFHGEEWLQQLLNYLSDNIQVIHTFLDKKIPRIKMNYPEATYLLWLNCKALKKNRKELHSFFTHKAKVGFNDGITFGDEGEGYQRMNFACPRVIILEALQRIEAAINSDEKAS